MAQSDYLTNLLGIDPSGTGQMRYEYTLPIFNELLSKGLTENQITGYDSNFGMFNQFPYKAKPNPQQNFAQYEVVPQVEGQVPTNDDEEEDTEVNINYGGEQNNTTDYSITTERYGTIRDQNPETLDITGVPFSQMSEQELMNFGKNKGYVGEDGTLLGPQQVSDADTPPGLLGFGFKMAEAPIQMLNDRQYNQFIKALKSKKMFLEGDKNKTFAEFSQAFKKANELSKLLNENLRVAGSSGVVKIPGTAKSVNAIFNQFSPSGPNNDVVYHTGSGGYYNSDGNFVTGYGQTVAFGSMDDAIDTLQAAASSGDSSIVPDKFDGDWVAKMNNAKTVSQSQKDEINNAWQQIQSNNYQNNNQDTFVPSGNMGNNFYQGNTAYGDADDYTDNESGI
tara:strand:- start:319 stop:1497 length:1179 start_codon:yes stop_codon:yes gene_type:complete